MSLPSSMADFVPCDRLLQKAYSYVSTDKTSFHAIKKTKSFGNYLKVLYCKYFRSLKISDGFIFAFLSSEVKIVQNFLQVICAHRYHVNR